MPEANKWSLIQDPTIRILTTKSHLVGERLRTFDIAETNRQQGFIHSRVRE